MARRTVIVLRLAALALGLTLAYRIYVEMKQPDALAELEAMSGMALPAQPAAAVTAQSAPATEAPPPLPPELAPIVTSGVFGKAPEKPAPQPQLVGLAGAKAIIATPSAGFQVLGEGAEAGGVKVVRIGINRVLVEFQGKVQELSIFSGLGGSSLLPQAAKEPKP